METAEGRGPGGMLESRAFFSANVAAENIAIAERRGRCGMVSPPPRNHSCVAQ